MVLEEHADGGVVQVIKTGLDSAGFKPEVRDLASFQDDYGWKAGEDEVDGAEEEEEEDDDEDEEEDEADGADDVDGKETNST